MEKIRCNRVCKVNLIYYIALTFKKKDPYIRDNPSRGKEASKNETGGKKKPGIKPVDR